MPLEDEHILVAECMAIGTGVRLEEGSELKVENDTIQVVKAINRKMHCPRPILTFV